MASPITVDADFRMGTGATVAAGTAGEALSPWDLLYIKSSDSKFYKAINSAEESATLAGICISPCSTDGNFAYVPHKAGVYVDHSSAIFTKGYTYIVGDTAGTMMEAGDAATSDYVSILGVAASTTSMYLVVANTSIVV